ncbi:MAG: hypothetical protein U5O39_13800 [Gammaproteobacteria bacterium]|nr:hypothetical protein [Gammaproteobacteria bacterium]
MIGVSRDTTDSYQERRALEAEKRRTENYLNIAEALIVAIDTEGRIAIDEIARATRFWTTRRVV